MANLTPEQFEKALANAKQALQANMGKILINATNLGSAEMQTRVFNRGLTTAGKRMEYRNAPSNYTNLRLDAGLQISYKDLTFTGNLFYSMNILSTAEKEVTYGFNNSDTAQIAEWQQTSDKQVNEPIFELNEKEKAKMEKQMALDAYAILQSAIDNFPSVPTAKTIQKRDAVSKSISRQQQKKAKRRKFERKQALKKKAQQAQVSYAKKQTRLEIQQKSLNKTNLKTSEAIKKKQSAEKALKANQFRRIDTKKRADYLQGVIKRKQAYADANAQKLSKSRPGSKASKEYARKLAQQKKEIDMAKQALSEVKQVNKLKKTIATSSKQLQKSREKYKTQTAKSKAYKKKVMKKERIKKVELRAKQLRMGTYKPKKRKKK
jgi:hypothetical protein